MKKTIIIFIAFLSTHLAIGQNNPKAQNILNNVSKTLEQCKNVEIKFTHTLVNKMVDIKQSSNGSAIIQGDKYLLNYLDNIILFDEKNNIVISPENEEVNITSATEMDNESITPSKLLSFYKKGYAYKLDKKTGVTQFIKLVPTKTSEEVAYVLLGVDTQKNQINSLTEVGKNGTNTSFTITSYKTNQTLAPNTFVFDKTKYQRLGYYINE